MRYVETTNSLMRAFRWCIAHATHMCARWVIGIQILCNTWVILVTTHV